MIPEVGDRVRVTGVLPKDPDPIPVGEEGVVTKVRNSSLGAQIEVDWDSGRKLMLLDTDPFIVF